MVKFESSSCQTFLMGTGKVFVMNCYIFSYFITMLHILANIFFCVSSSNCWLNYREKKHIESSYIALMMIQFGSYTKFEVSVTSHRCHRGIPL